MNLYTTKKEWLIKIWIDHIEIKQQYIKEKKKKISENKLNILKPVK